MKKKKVKRCLYCDRVVVDKSPVIRICTKCKSKGSAFHGAASSIDSHPFVREKKERV